jgi:hypothetical protein
MALHKVSLYVRSRGGSRSRLPAYPGVAYQPGTIYQQIRDSNRAASESGRLFPLPHIRRPW